MESNLGRKNIEIIRNEKDLLQKSALSTMKSFQIIIGEVATVCFAVFVYSQVFFGINPW